jgi:hypothetical protein
VAHRPSPTGPDDGVLASPVPSMLELSAALRAVTAETELWPAVAALQGVARSLTRSWDATAVIYDWDRRAAWTLDGATLPDDLGERCARVATRGQREVLGPLLIEPIGWAPARGVIALRRFATDRFSSEDVALVAALVGGLVGTLHRLLGKAVLTARP